MAGQATQIVSELVLLQALRLWCRQKVQGLGALDTHQILPGFGKYSNRRSRQATLCYQPVGKCDAKRLVAMGCREEPSGQSLGPVRRELLPPVRYQPLISPRGIWAGQVILPPPLET